MNPYKPKHMPTIFNAGQLLTFLLLYAVDSEEVDDSGREVQSDVVFVLLDGQTVAVTVAGSGHPSTV